MYRRKICIVLTYRGNYGKIKSTLHALKSRGDNVEIQLVVGGAIILEKYGNLVQDIIEDGFEISREIHFLLEGENPVTMAKSTGNAITELATAFENLTPDIVVTIADRFEALAVAVAASYMNIPVAHLEGGEISGSIDESIRHAITKLSHIHLAATRQSAQRIIALGEDENLVHIVGSPSLDLMSDLKLDFDPIRKYGGVGADFEIHPHKYIVVSQHPVTTEYRKVLEQINQTIEAIIDIDMPAIWIWPNMDAGSDKIAKGIRIFREKHLDSKIRFYKYFPIEDYSKLISNCACLVGNTSSGIREGAYLGVPVVNIGSRQNARERGHNVLDVPYDKEIILTAIKKQISNGPYKMDPLYGNGKSGEKIAHILMNCPLNIQKQNRF